MYEQTFMSALQRFALHAASDSDDTDRVGFGRAVVCY